MSIQYVVEHIATVFAAISGAMAGRGKNVDLFGVLVLALVTALGGGTLRDVILDARPVFWVGDPSYVITAAIAALLYFIVARFWIFPYTIMLVADAAGLALFTVVGVHKAMTLQASPIVAVVMGVMTGVAGGAIRDILTNEIPLIARHEITLYATASLCGAGAFVLLQPLIEVSTAWGLAIATTLILRLAAIRWELRLPLFKTRESIDNRTPF